jgi:hypothetical protein
MMKEEYRAGIVRDVGKGEQEAKREKDRVDEKVDRCEEGAGSSGKGLNEVEGNCE